MEQRAKKGPIRYIVDHTLRGDAKVDPVILRQKGTSESIFSNEVYASMIIIRAYKRWRWRCRIEQNWNLVQQISVPRHLSPYTLEVYEALRPELRLNRCKLRLFNPKTGEQFFKFIKDS